MRQVRHPNDLKKRTPKQKAFFERFIILGFCARERGWLRWAIREIPSLTLQQRERLVEIKDSLKKLESLTKELKP